MKSFRGRKSLGASTPKTATRIDDNLFGTDTVEVIPAVSEGPCQGLVDGPAGFLVADVPLVDAGTNTPNISNFELRVLKGTTPADSILPNLGGIGSSRNVGLDLRTQLQQVVAAGQTTQIDYIDLRFTIGRLFSTNDRGDELQTGLALKVEVKPRSASVWGVPFTNEPPPTEQNTAGASNYRPGAQNPGSHVNAAYHETYIQSDEPSAATAKPGAMWFRTDTANWQPLIRSADAAVWVVPNALAGGAVDDGFYLWTWFDVFGTARAAWYDQSGRGRSPADGRMTPNDFLLVPNGSQDVYAWNGVNWNATSDQFTSPTPVEPGRFDIFGITRTTYPYEVRIPVARINEPYDVRVTRLSEKETKYFFAQVNWESFQEIKRDVYSFPGLALSHLTIKATDTFTSLPEFTQIWDGRIIRVPSNYDPVARTYAGFWDGTFKLAFSNNPAWVAYDLVMNTFYGKNRYFPEVLDPLATYEFGKHCDAHKFYMNEYITDPRSISETINYIVGTAGGRYVDRGDGYSTILFDADDQPAVAQFAQENVIDGLFTYSFTDITARKNDFRVSFVNPLIGWVEDRVRVYDQNSIDVQGTNPEEFIAVGCTDAEEAVRRGRLRLVTALAEKTICSFKTNRQGRFLQPFQVILIADPNAQQIISGRVMSVVSGTVLQLRDEIYLEPGIPLTVTFTVPDNAGGFQIRSYPLANASGGRTSVLNLATPLDVTLPEKAVFSIGTPKAYRITGIEETEDPDNISITVIEINRLKWAFVDGLVDLDDVIALQSGPLSRYTYPPTDLQVSAVARPDGTVTGILSWLASPSQAGGYRVFSSYEGKRSDLIGEPGNVTQFEIPNLQVGVYVFTVTTLSLDRTTESAPASVRFILGGAGAFRPVLGPSGLRLVDEDQAPIFKKKDAVFTWDPPGDPLFSKFKVDILSNNGAQRRTSNQDGVGYTYTLDANRGDGGGVPARNFTLQLRVLDTTGHLSDPVALAVSHPPPVAIVPELSALSESAVIQYVRPAEPDWQGTLIWMSETLGFDPLSTPPLDVGMQLVVFLKGTPGKTYYIRIAGYDSFGKTGLNISPEYELKITILLFDPFAPNIPDIPVLTTAAEIAVDGTVSAQVGATWTQDPNSNFGKYEVFYAESLPGTLEQDKRYVSDVTSLAAWERHGFIPGRLVSVKTRALSRNGFAASSFSPVATIIAALNLAPPANPTNFTAAGGFERAYLSWTPAPNLDLDYVEVWSLDAPSSASSPPAGSVLRTTVAAGSNFYPDTLPTTGIRTYWLRSVNTSATKAASYVGPVQASSAALVGAQIAAGIIDATKIAVNLKTIEVLSALPTTGNTDGRTVYTGGFLQTYDASQGKFVAAAGSLDTLPGQIKSTQIADGAISTPKLNVNDIFSNTAVINQITAGVLTAGAIKTTMLAAGVITADKIGVGLGLGNLVWNSDFTAGVLSFNFSNTVTNGGDFYSGYNASGATWQPPGMGSTQTSCSGTPSGGVMDTYYNNPAADGSYDFLIPCQPNKRYEGSVYISAHRIRAYVCIGFYAADRSYIGELAGTNVENYQGSGPLSGWARSTLFAVSPNNAAYIRIWTRGVPNGGAGPYIFTTGVYLGLATANQTEFSPYTPSSNTVINGGSIATNSLNANKIVAGSITGDRIAANTIDVAKINAESLRVRIINTDGIQAGYVLVGSTRLSSWVSGSDSTKIEGGQISTNSINTNQLKVGSRSIQLVGISFYTERDGNGNLTGVVGWTAGYILTVNDNGAPVNYSIPASRVSINGNYWYIWWNKGAANLSMGQDNWPAIYTDQNNVLIATVSNFTGISVLVGGTIIDGSRITAYSISAVQIGANQIQAQHIAANSISGDRIIAGSLSADKITSGSLTSGIIYVGYDKKMYLDSNPGLLRCFNRSNNSEAISLGYLGFWTGNRDDYGLIIRDTGNNEVARFSATGNRMTGAIIDNATITTAKIGEAQIDYLRVAGGAISQILSASSDGVEARIGFNCRGPSSRFQITAFRRGAGGQRYGIGGDNGALYIQYSTDNANYANLDGIPNVASYQWDANARGNFLVPQTTTLFTTWSPGYTGVLYVRVVDTNNLGLGGVYISITELAR